jgi:hypothetical protein
VNIRIDIPRNLLITGILFFGSFLFSLGAFIIERFDIEKRLLFFPEHIQRSISGEVRNIIKHNSLEDNLEIFIREIILGPMNIKHGRLFSPETKVRSVVIREGIAYVDFSSGILLSGEEVKIAFDESLECLKNALLFNFTRLKDVIFTVEGQIPGKPVYLPKSGKKETTVEKAGKNR